MNNKRKELVNYSWIFHEMKKKFVRQIICSELFTQL